MSASILARTALRGALRTRPVALSPQGFAVRAFSVKFAETHEWLRTDNGTATLGISDFAQGQLGEVVYVDLPDAGATFSAKDTIVTLESVKAVGEVYAPADCEVVEVNEQLAEEPALVNGEPMAGGWLIKIKLSSEPSLMDEAAYEKHVEASADE